MCAATVTATALERRPLPPLPNRLALAFGRPTWLEARQRRERLALRQHPVTPPTGRGRPLLIVPGYGGSDESMAPLAAWLVAGGFEVTVAPLERNIRSSSWAADRVGDALEALGAPAVLVGHSRGGQAARVAAARNPSRVSQLVTLGAPVRHHYPEHILLRTSFEALRAAAFLRLFAEWNPAAERAFAADLFAPFPDGLPWTSIWTPTDGYVAPEACLDSKAVSMQVSCTHRGLVESVASFEAIAAVLDE